MIKRHAGVFVVVVVVAAAVVLDIAVEQAHVHDSQCCKYEAISPLNMEVNFRCIRLWMVLLASVARRYSTVTKLRTFFLTWANDMLFTKFRPLLLQFRFRFRITSHFRGSMSV